MMYNVFEMYKGEVVLMENILDRNIDTVVNNIINYEVECDKYFIEKKFKNIDSAREFFTSIMEYDAVMLYKYYESKDESYKTETEKFLITKLMFSLDMHFRILEQRKQEFLS